MAVFFDILLIVGFISVWGLPAKRVDAAAQDLCGFGDIELEHGTIFFNSSSPSLYGFPHGCHRAVRVPKAKIKLTVEKLAISGNDSFKIYDSPYSDESHLIDISGKKAPFVLESTGNALFISFQASKDDEIERSIFEAGFMKIIEPATCLCRGVLNGAMDCDQSTRHERKCEIKCLAGYMDLTLGGNLSCNIDNGKWNKDIHNTTLSCQKVSHPKELSLNLNFNYKNGTCREVNKTVIERSVKTFLSSKTDISTTGQCYRNDIDKNCKPMVITCQELQDKKPKVSINITDRVKSEADVETGSSKFSSLNQSYSTVSFQDMIDGGKLNVVTGNKSCTLEKASFLKGKVLPVCDSDTDYIVPGILDYPVCSICPRHHIYNSETYQCQACPAETTAGQGARTCQKGQRGVAIQTSCKSKCSGGKGIMAMGPSHCQWCPKNTYQNTSEALGSTCVKCPDKKLTPFSGARNQAQCFSPCSKGTSLDTKTAKCNTCSQGTYQDATSHVFLTCKSCMPGHFSASPSQCEPCAIGHYQDNARQKSCKKCPNGKTTKAVGAQSESRCVSSSGSTPDFEFGIKKDKPEVKAETKPSKSASTIGLGIGIAAIILITIIAACILRQRRLRNEASGNTSLLRMRKFGSNDYRVMEAPPDQLGVLDEEEEEELNERQTNV